MLEMTSIDGVEEIYEVKAEISTSDEEPYLEIRGGEGFSGSIELKLSRKDKKLWGKVFMMPKCRVTEWANPRKKKRGSMRRARRERRA